MVRHRPNLLILGASGMVATAVLLRAHRWRDLFGKLVLLDRRKGVVSNRHLDHRRLDYTFIWKTIALPRKGEEYEGVLSKHRIDVVLDLTTHDSIPVLRATDGYGASYVNTSMNVEHATAYSATVELMRGRDEYDGAPHIICSGMNPGVVNMWVTAGIEEYGLPEQVVHFEYDTSMLSSGWKPMVTWCRKEFIEETTRDRSMVMLGGYMAKESTLCALLNEVPMAGVLKPIMKLGKYPSGFVVPHEECIAVSVKYGIPSKFIYAIHPKTMEALPKLFKRRGRIAESDLALGDNVSHPLTGEDSIGVMLEYKDRLVYFFNSVANDMVFGTNATCWQVSVGVIAALRALGQDELKVGIHFVSDLRGTHYHETVIEDLRTEKYVFRKTRKGLRLEGYDSKVIV